MATLPAGIKRPPRDLGSVPQTIDRMVRLPLERITEAVRLLQGNTDTNAPDGVQLDRALTLRDFEPSGRLAGVSLGGAPGTTAGPPGPQGPPGTPTPVYEPDLTPPPNLTGLSATAGFTSVVVQWDAALYLQGHGHGQTNIYAAQRDPADLSLPTFGDAQRVFEATGALTIAAIPSELNTRWHIWAKWQTVDGVESVSPAGGVNGITVTTGQDIEQLLDLLTGQITQTQLFADLGARINLIDGPDSLFGSVGQRLLAEATARGAAILTERTERIDGDNFLASSITLLSAGTGEQFDYSRIYYFDSGVEGWTGNGAPTATASFLRPADHATDAYVESPTGLGADGTVYGQFKVRIRKVGAPVWDGFVWWRAPSDTTWDAARRATLTEPTFDANGIAVVTRTPGWGGITVDRIRIDLSAAQTATDYFEIDWAAVGRPSPGASSAALFMEQSARAAGDAANASSITALTATVGINTAAIATEATARASADGSLFAQYTVKIDVNGYVSGFGLASTPVNGTPLSTFIVRADRFAIASPIGPGIDPIVPFSVNTTPFSENGINFPAAVYIDAAIIKNVSALVARLRYAWIDDAVIANLSAAKLTAGDGTIGGRLKSANYVAGVSGWRVDPNGFAEFGNALVRGTVFSTNGVFDGQVTIRDPLGGIVFQSGGNLDISRVSTALDRLNTRPNLLLNGGFENGLIGWTDVPPGFAVSDGIWGRIASSGAIANGTYVLQSASFPVQAGETYTISGDSLLFAASGLSYFDLLFLNSVGAVVGDGGQNSVNATHDFSTTDSNRSVHAVASVAPAGTARAVARYVFTGTSITAVGCRQIKVERGGLPYTRYTADATVAATTGVATSSVNPANPITPANVSTYIASAAIGDAQIGNIIQSTGYTPGSTGWRINKDGTAEFRNIIARGDIQATSLNAATGTFTGALVAATGSFSGALNAASGSFSGVLTAFAINAVDTINLRGQAITIPVSAYSAGSVAASSAGTVVQTVGITSTGAPILVIGGATIGGFTVGGNATAALAVFRNGIEICRATGQVEGTPGTLSVNTPPITDTPGAGAHTYQLVAFGITASQRGILLLETKR